jgi:hypothetical protein
VVAVVVVCGGFEWRVVLKMMRERAKTKPPTHNLNIKLLLLLLLLLPQLIVLRPQVE